MTLLRFFAELGTPAELRQAALSAPRASGGGVPKHNSHIHLPPNFSAFTSVAQAVERAKAEGCVALGVSNYYDFTVYGDFVARAKAAKLFPLLGLEVLCRDQALADAGVKVNDPGNPGKVYLCGKGITRFVAPTAVAMHTLTELRRNDAERISEMVRRCLVTFAERGCVLTLDASSIIGMIATRGGVDPATVFLQERHVALDLQEALFVALPANGRLAALTQLLGTEPKLKNVDDAVGLQAEIRNHLMKAGKPGFVPESYISLDDAKRLIGELGGFACYPVVGDGMNPPSPFEADPTTLADNVAKIGIHAADFISLRNAPAALEGYVTELRKRGIIVTNGTEHNTPDLIPVEPTCVKGAPVPENVRAIFWEGACVVAAHQFLIAHGEAGFIAADGTPHPAFATAEARIAAFAALGAEVIARWNA